MLPVEGFDVSSSGGEKSTLILSSSTPPYTCQYTRSTHDTCRHTWPTSHAGSAKSPKLFHGILEDVFEKFTEKLLGTAM